MHSTDVHLIFEGTGSRGDVAPLIALATTLAARGYRCQLLSNSRFGAEAEHQGLEFSAIIDRNANFDKGEQVGFGEYLFPGLSVVKRRIEAEDAERVVVVNLSRFGASNLLCERRKIPTLRLNLSPFVFRSLVSPPWPFREKTQGPLGQLYKNNVLPRIYAALDTHQRMLAYVNEHRLKFGLAPVTSAAYRESHVAKQVAAFPSWFCEPAADWPADVETVGFPLPKPQGSLPQEILELVMKHGAPIVFTPGTSMDPSDAFVALARACCERLGMPGVFLSQLRPRTAYHYDGRFLELPYAELSLLLPRARLIVHHGGIGTAARALQAKVPQIISPMGFDQPDNGNRVRLLGAGLILDRDSLTAERLAGSVRELLSSSDVRQRLDTLGPQMVDGLGRVADLVERLATRRALSSGQRPSQPACVPT